MGRIRLAGCAIIEKGKLLLIWKIKEGHYEFPGGRVEKDESKEDTAIRETREEIGCEVKILNYWGYEDFGVRDKELRGHVFLAELGKGQVPRIIETKIFRDIRWVPIEEYRDYAVAPNVRMFCEDYLKKKGSEEDDLSI